MLFKTLLLYKAVNLYIIIYKTLIRYDNKNSHEKENKKIILRSNIFCALRLREIQFKAYTKVLYKGTVLAYLQEGKEARGVQEGKEERRARGKGRK